MDKPENEWGRPSRAPSESPSPKQAGRDRFTLVLAVFGATVSVLALILSFVGFHEDTEVKIDGAAVANELGSTPAGYGVRASIINSSLRPVIVRSVSLFVDGHEVAPADEYLPNPRVLSDQSTRGDEPLKDASPFPFAIPARGARTIGPLLNFGRADEIFYARRHGPVLRGAREFCRQLTLAPANGHRIELRIETEPGGATDIPIEVIGPLDGGNQWYLSIEGPRDAPNGVEVHRKVSAPSSVREMRIQVWRLGAHPVRDMRAPLFGAEWARFRFPPLPKGQYRITLSDRSRLVAGGVFSVPRTGPFDWALSPSEATETNFQCALFDHLRFRAVTPQPLPKSPF